MKTSLKENFMKTENMNDALFYNSLIEELNELIAKNEIELEELINKDKSLNDQLLTIVKQKEVASILNDDFDKLATLINDLETLEFHKEEINTLTMDAKVMMYLVLEHIENHIGDIENGSTENN